MVAKLTHRVTANARNAAAKPRIKATPKHAGKAGAPRAAKTATSGIFASLEKARTNLMEGDANLERARRVLG